MQQDESHSRPGIRTPLSLSRASIALPPDATSAASFSDGFSVANSWLRGTRTSSLGALQRPSTSSLGALERPSTPATRRAAAARADAAGRTASQPLTLTQICWEPKPSTTASFEDGNPRRRTFSDSAWRGPSRARPVISIPPPAVEASSADNCSFCRRVSLAGSELPRRRGHSRERGHQRRTPTKDVVGTPTNRERGHHRRTPSKDLSWKLSRGERSPRRRNLGKEAIETPSAPNSSRSRAPMLVHYDWEPRLANLKQRFADLPQRVVVAALVDHDGHGGRAAEALEAIQGSQRSSPDRAPETTVATPSGRWGLERSASKSSLLSSPEVRPRAQGFLKHSLAAAAAAPVPTDIICP